MNSSLLRLASARPSARFRWACTASLSVRSCITRAKDRACLFSSSSGVTVARHQNRVAVLAHLPAIASARTVRQRRLEFMLGLAREDVFGRKEAGEVLPDDFVGLIAEEAFRSGVPAEQVSVESDQENGVLLRIGRQQVESLSHFLSGKTIGIVGVQMASPFEGLNGGYRQRATQRKTEAVTFTNGRADRQSAMRSPGAIGVRSNGGAFKASTRWKCIASRLERAVRSPPTPP